MKLKFDKNANNETIVSVEGDSFSSEDYIEIIKQLCAGQKVEVEFEEKVTGDERVSINEMVRSINAISSKEIPASTDESNNDSALVYPEEINPEDIPF